MFPYFALVPPPPPRPPPQALDNLTCVVGNEKVLVEGGVASCLTIVALFKSDERLIKDLCAAALFNLMFDTSGRERLMKDGALWASVRLASRRPQDAPEDDAPAGDHDGTSSAPSSPGVGGAGDAHRQSITKPHFLRLRTSRSMSSASLLEVRVRGGGVVLGMGCVS